MASVDDACKYLLDLPTDVVMTIRAGKNVMQETGELGEAIDQRRVRWTIDPTRPGALDRSPVPASKRPSPTSAITSFV